MNTSKVGERKKHKKMQTGKPLEIWLGRESSPVLSAIDDREEEEEDKLYV